MQYVISILTGTWDCISSFELYGIRIVPLIFTVCGIYVFVRILSKFLKMGGD